MKKKIAVLMGGFSHEAQISMKSGETVMKNIDTALYDVYRIVIDETGWNAHIDGQIIAIDKNDFSIPLSTGKISFDLAFIVIHGTPGEDGKLQAYFDMLGMRYTTSDALTSMITFNKYTCNNLLKHYGIRCAKSVLVRKGDTLNAEKIAAELGFPMFVKPCDGGSSFGVSKVKSMEEIMPAVENAIQHGTEVVIEAFVNGTEVTCGIFNLLGKTTVLPATEIVSKNEFFDFEAKYKGESEEITPARISPEMMKEIQSITSQAYRLLNLKGLARIDFIIQDNAPHLIEVNTVPGLSEQSIIPQQARCVGISLQDLFGNMILDALQR
jgi:D-alanine-D-alanine ligase